MTNEKKYAEFRILLFVCPRKKYKILQKRVMREVSFYDIILATKGKEPRK